MSDPDPIIYPVLTLTIGPPGPPPRTWMLESDAMESPLITFQEYPPKSTRPELVAAGLDVITNYATMCGLDKQVLIDTIIIVDSVTKLPTRHNGHGDGAITLTQAAHDTVTGVGHGELVVT